MNYDDVIGDYYELKTIGRMDLDGQCTKAGELNQARRGHNVIYDGEYLMVVGGSDELRTEKCSLTDRSVSCTSQNLELDEYTTYPEVFPVAHDFCHN